VTKELIREVIFDCLPDVTAKCKEEVCRWQGEGKVYSTEGIVVMGGVIEDCRQHHNDVRAKSKAGQQHNQFRLEKDRRKIGFAVVASGTTTGSIWS